MQDITILSELETAVNNARQKVGTRSLIYYLNRLDTYFDYKTDNQFKLIESLVMHDFGIRTPDVYKPNVKKPDLVNAKRIIIFLLKGYTGLDETTICQMVNIKKRTLWRYQETMIEVVHNPSIDRKLYERYLRINKLFKTTL